MATKGNAVSFHSGTYAQYQAIAVKSADALYFCTDTKQLFLGEAEYTKSTKMLTATPTATTAGDDGALYAYNGSLYLCKNGTDGKYDWTRVANVNDYVGTVTSVTAGEGLATADGEDIEVSGTIQHAIPVGAAATADDLTDQTATFGGTVKIKGVSTDKFGHVIAVNEHSITMPTETVVSVTDETATAVTLKYGEAFTVVTEVEKGDGSHEIVRTATTYTLPESDQHDTTYVISATEEGKIHVAPSEGDAYDVNIVGWSDLAKKADITRVFKFKGTVAKVADLPSSDQVEGDVYFVTADQSEYVWVVPTEGAAGSWEKLGPVIDLSDYALSEDVIQRVEGATGYVPKFTADGTLESTGFTIGVSVPADAKFTDTIYEAPTYGEHATGFYKFETDAAGYVKSVTAVTADDITALGIASEDYVDDAVKDAKVYWEDMA